MNAIRRIRPLAIAALAVPLAFFAGCVNWAEMPISKDFPVGANPTPECVQAAKEASYYCAPKHQGIANAEGQFKCDKARWEHARKC